MEEPALALILDKCLAAMDEGTPPEAAARMFPALEQRILPLLRVSSALRDSVNAFPVSQEFLDRLGAVLRNTPCPRQP